MNTGLKEQEVINIELDDNYKNEITGKLNLYLGNVQIAYMNVRGYHWNITGEHFFVLHEKFEGVYNKLNKMADEIAERILMLGGKPVHSYSEYIRNSSIKEKVNVRSATDTVRALLEDTAILLENEREIISIASDNNDEATANQLTDYLEDHEKMNWMFNAFLR